MRLDGARKVNMSEELSRPLGLASNEGLGPAFARWRVSLQRRSSDGRVMQATVSALNGGGKTLCCCDEETAEADAQSIADAMNLADRVAAAPLALMDTRTALGLCAPTEDDFPALQALQCRRVALVDLGPNAKVIGGGTPSAALPGYAGDNNNNGET